jgi:hypothetical protein
VLTEGRTVRETERERQRERDREGGRGSDMDVTKPIVAFRNFANAPKTVTRNTFTVVLHTSFVPLIVLVTHAGLCK